MPVCVDRISNQDTMIQWRIVTKFLLLFTYIAFQREK